MRIVFQGDSITDAGRGEWYGHGYALMVSAMLGDEEAGQHQFFNRGVSGNRIVDMYSRIEKDCLSLNPDLISILIGINDVWRDMERINRVNAEKYEKIYDMYMSEVIAYNPDIKVIIMGPSILKGSTTYSEEDNRWETHKKQVEICEEIAQKIAEKYSRNAVYVPLQNVFDQALKRADESQWTKDGIHPTPQGHLLIAREWLKAYKTLK